MSSLVFQFLIRSFREVFINPVLLLVNAGTLWLADSVSHFHELSGSAILSRSLISKVTTPPDFSAPHGKQIKKAR